VESFQRSPATVSTTRTSASVLRQFLHRQIQVIRLWQDRVFQNGLVRDERVFGGRVPHPCVLCKGGIPRWSIPWGFDSFGHERVRGAPQALKRGVFADDLRHE